MTYNVVKKEILIEENKTFNYVYLGFNSFVVAKLFVEQELEKYKKLFWEIGTQSATFDGRKITYTIERAVR